MIRDATLGTVGPAGFYIIAGTQVVAAMMAEAGRMAEAAWHYKCTIKERSTDSVNKRTDHDTRNDRAVC